MVNDEVAPPGVDITRPSIARVYDFFIGGKDHFAIDRVVAERALQINPDAPAAGFANRAFLRRAVRFMAGEAGVRQFLDLGSGLPSNGNVHEVAHAVDPQAHVVYVDNDPMVLAHGRALLADEVTTTVIQADVRSPREILDHPETRRYLDFDAPIGLLMMAILHHIRDDEDPAGIAATLRDAMPSGSYLAIAHFCDPGDAYPVESAKAKEVERIFNESLGTGRFRAEKEVRAYFGDWELLEPGLVPLREWRTDPSEVWPEQGDTYHTFIGGVARKA